MKNARPPVHRASHQRGRAHRLAVWHRFAQRKRASARARGYDRDWHELRTAHLIDEPWCRACAAQGIDRRAALVDHIESISVRPDLRLDPSNLQSLCWPCHNAKTIRYDGGFGRPRRGLS